MPKSRAADGQRGRSSAGRPPGPAATPSSPSKRKSSHATRHTAPADAPATPNKKARAVADVAGGASSGVAAGSRVPRSPKKKAKNRQPDCETKHKVPPAAARKLSTEAIELGDSSSDDEETDQLVASAVVEPLPAADVSKAAPKSHVGSAAAASAPTSSSARGHSSTLYTRTGVAAAGTPRPARNWSTFTLEDDSDAEDIPCEDVEGLWAESPPPDGTAVMGFGKHSQLTHAEVFKQHYSYVEWCRTCDDPSSAMEAFLQYCDSVDRVRPAPKTFLCPVHNVRLKGPLTSKNGYAHNVGRKFYICREKTDDDDCSLDGGFRWADGAKPFSDESCEYAENYHGLAPGSVFIDPWEYGGYALP